ncbi:MAG: MIP/aquaporin family protein [Sphingomicrobium sp.]
MPRRLAAEALGSFFLFATVIGSGIMGVALAGGNDGIALLGNSIATGAMLFVLITMLGPISGAHFNPAVSLVAAVRRSLSWRDTAAYVAAQFGGGLLGAVAAHAMYGQRLIQTSLHVRAGPGQWLGEAIATFGLIVTIIGTVRHARRAVPASVALTIVAGYWFTSSTSFANPAITLVRSLTGSFAGIAPASAPAFVAAQLLGAALAAGVAHWLFEEGR